MFDKIAALADSDHLYFISTAKTLGRAIRRLISCYEPITGIINEGDRRAINAAEGISDSPPTTEEEVELAHEYVPIYFFDFLFINNVRL